jgi:hypothetical protein
MRQKKRRAIPIQMKVLGAAWYVPALPRYIPDEVHPQRLGAKGKSQGKSNKAKPESKVKAKPDSTAKTKAKPDSTAKAKAKPESTAKAESATKAKAKPESTAKAKSTAKSKPVKAKAEAEAKVKQERLEKSKAVSQRTKAVTCECAAYSAAANSIILIFAGADPHTKDNIGSQSKSRKRKERDDLTESPTSEAVPTKKLAGDKSNAPTTLPIGQPMDLESTNSQGSSASSCPQPQSLTPTRRHKRSRFDLGALATSLTHASSRQLQLFGALWQHGRRSSRVDTRG